MPSLAAGVCLAALGGGLVPPATSTVPPGTDDIVIATTVDGSTTLELADLADAIEVTIDGLTHRPTRLVGSNEARSTDRSERSWVVEFDAPDIAAVISTRSQRAGTTELVATVTGDGARSGVDSLTIRFEASADERFFGLGERADAVEHRGGDVVNRVVDGPWTAAQGDIVASLVPPAGYSERQDATYFPLPWLLSTRGYGLLVTNDAPSEFRLAGDDAPDSWSVSVAEPEANSVTATIFTGASPADVLGAMTATIGRQPALAAPHVFGPWYQFSGDEADEIAALAAAGVPTSLVQTYTHYLPCGDHEGQRNAQRERVERAHAAGMAITTYVNPMMCVDYPTRYRAAALSGAFTGSPEGGPYHYRYSTATSFDVAQFDFTAEAGRQAFWRVLTDAVVDGYDGWMEDFGEYTPDDAVSADGTPGPVMHNRYPVLYHGAAAEFAEQQDRPLVRFVRSGWTGSAASSPVVWGGDPSTEWGFDGLESAVRSALGMGLSGVGVWGSDIGGFFTWIDEDLSTELLARWIEFGAFSGVMRLQSGGISLSENDRPTVLDDELLPTWHRYSVLRTRLYPYIAGSHDAYLHAGLPLMRHLLLDSPDDAEAITHDDEFLFGADLLVAPVTEPGAQFRDVYLPDGEWIDWWPMVDDDGDVNMLHVINRRGGQTQSVRAPLGYVPLLVRAGAVIPLLPRDVDTLSPYGGDAVVNLDDRNDERQLVAFPSGDWSGPLGPGETMTSTLDADAWTLTMQATAARTYRLNASFVSAPAGFTPCRLDADGEAVPFEFAGDGGRVLTATLDLDADSIVTVHAC